MSGERATATARNIMPDIDGSNDNDSVVQQERQDDAAAFNTTTIVPTTTMKRRATTATTASVSALEEEDADTTTTLTTTTMSGSPTKRRRKNSSSTKDNKNNNDKENRDIMGNDDDHDPADDDDDDDESPTTETTAASAAKEDNKEEYVEDDETTTNNKKKKSKKSKSTKKKAQCEVTTQRGEGGDDNNNNNNNKEEEVDDAEHGDAEGVERDDEASASIQRKKSINPTGRTAEAGIIHKIYLENFMCHAKLTVELGPNANAITGDNGSGKSAVLAALQIGLGANARRTHRARNLKDLIRRNNVVGAASSYPQAKIQITLLNGGPDAYQPDKYGAKITVERGISSTNSGFNGYRLLDENMRIVSEKKADLEEMLDHLNIQVENPVSVLDQEESKKFLTGKPADKYAFFMKATELERIDISYASTIEEIKKLQDALKKNEEQLAPRLEDVQRKKKRWQQHQELDKLQGKFREAQAQLLWATYSEAQERYEQATQRLADCKDKLQRKEKELEELEQEFGDPNTNKKELMQAKMVELLEEANEQVELKRRLDGQLKAALAPLKQAESQRKHLDHDLKMAKRELIQAQKRLQEYRDEMMAHEGSAESNRTRLLNELKQLEHEREKCKENADPLKQATSEAHRAYEEIEPEVRQAKDNAKQAAYRLDGAKNALRRLEASTDEFAVLGPKVKLVHDAVEKAKRERKFRGPVLGPIGKYVKVVPGKEEFAGLAELSMGPGILDRFIVTCDQDRLTLQDIRKRTGCGRECGIFDQPISARYGVPNPTVPETETAATLLSVSEDLVFNCLVDNARIDQRALARDKKSSESHLLVTNPDNSYSILDPVVKKVFYLPKGDSWEVLTGGNLFSISNDKQMRATIGVDKSQAIADAQRDIQQLGEDLNAARTADAKLEEEHTKRQRAWNRAKRAMQQNDDHINDLAAKIDNVNNEVQNSMNVAFDPSEYEDDVAQAESKLEQIKAKDSRLQDEIENRQPEIKEIKDQIADVTQRIIKVQADVSAVQEEQTKFLETQSQTQGQIEKRRAKLEGLHEKVTKAEAEVSNNADLVAQTLRSARLLQFNSEAYKASLSKGKSHADADDAFDPSELALESIEPVTVSKGSQYYEARLQNLKSKIEQERRQRKISNETPEEAYEEYIKAQEELNKVEAERQVFSDQVDNLAKDQRKRTSKHNAMREYLKKVTADKFDDFLSMNQYNGKLTFDDSEGSLNLEVKKMSEKGKTMDAKGLSGGERSFTTMCLLLALGEHLETPFRIFDEFDVFLDAEARKLVMKQLLYMAAKLEHRQFIFITPQDLSGLKQGDKLKILKLKPPKRHGTGDTLTQQTLNFGSQD